MRKRRAFAQRVTYATLMVESSAVPTRPLNLPPKNYVHAIVCTEPMPHFEVILHKFNEKQIWKETLVTNTVG